MRITHRLHLEIAVSRPKCALAVTAFFITSHKQSKLLFTAPPLTHHLHTLQETLLKKKYMILNQKILNMKCSVVKGKLEFFTEKFYLEVKFKMFFNVFKYNYFYTCPLKNWNLKIATVKSWLTKSIPVSSQKRYESISFMKFCKKYK